jgi:hypothetical protein
MKHAAGLAQDREITADMYVLIDEQRRTIKPSHWLDLIASGEVENRIFGLQKNLKDTSPQNKREFIALSARLLGSGNSPGDVISAGRQYAKYSEFMFFIGMLILRKGSN